MSPFHFFRGRDGRFRERPWPYDRGMFGVSPMEIVGTAFTVCAAIWVPMKVFEWFVS